MWLSDCVSRLTSGLSIVVIQLTHVTVGTFVVRGHSCVNVVAVD